MILTTINETEKYSSSEQVMLGKKTKHYSAIAKYLVILMIISTMLFSYLPLGNQINFFFSLAAVGVIVMLALIYRKPVWFGMEMILLSLWVIYAILPSLTAIKPELAIIKLSTMGQLLVLSVLMINVSLWSGDSRPFIWAFVLAAFLSYLIGFTPLAGIQLENRVVGEEMGRTVGTLRNANTFGVVMVEAAYMMSCLIILTKRRVVKLIVLVCMMVFAVAIISSGSRTAGLGLVVLMIILSWSFNVFSFRRPRMVVSAVLFGVVIIAIGIYTYNNDLETQKRYDILYDVVNAGDVEAETNANSLKGRAEFARIAWDFAINKYPFGIGLDNFKVYAGKYTHSNIMEVMVSTGIIGLIMFYCIYISVFIKAIKIKAQSPRHKILLRVLIGFPVLLLMTDVTNVSYYTKNTWISMALVIATLELLRRQNLEKSR